MFGKVQGEYANKKISDIMRKYPEEVFMTLINCFLYLIIILS